MLRDLGFVCGSVVLAQAGPVGRINQALIRSYNLTPFYRFVCVDWDLNWCGSGLVYGCVFVWGWGQPRNMRVGGWCVCVVVCYGGCVCAYGFGICWLVNDINQVLSKSYHLTQSTYVFLHW